MAQCCISGFRWDGKPQGKESKLAQNDAYVVGNNKDVAILIIPDLFGWKMTNNRLLADHYAEEVNATVYLTDFFDGEVVPEDALERQFDTMAFLGRNSKDKRYPEIKGCATALKHDLGFKKVGAVGHCYGGWAVFQLGAKGNTFVDAISTAHPSLLTKEDINNVAVPTQILSPEHDPVFTPELKLYVNEKIPTLNIQYDYQYFPGLAHGFAVRGDPSNPTEKAGLERAKNDVSGWMSHFLHLQ